MRVIVVSSSLAIVGAASAQNLTVSVKSSLDGSTWASEVTAVRGQTVRVAIWLSGDSSIYGFNGAELRLQGTSLAAGDAVTFGAGTNGGAVGPFSPTRQNAIFRDAPGQFRVDDSQDGLNINGSAGLTFFQRDPGTAPPGGFSTDNPAMCFRFDLAIADDGGPDRDISMVLDQLTRGVVSYYTASNATRAVMGVAGLEGGVIHVVPAPGAAVLGLMACVGVRRRAR